MYKPDCFMCVRANRLGWQGRLAVLPNRYPIKPMHLLLAADQHSEGLKEDFLHDALAFARRYPQFLVFHNMRVAGASRPEHLHFQAIPDDRSLPILSAPVHRLLTVNGVAVSRVEGHAACAIEAETKNAGTVAFAVLQTLRPTPFNLLMTADRIIIVPRTVETPSGFSNMFGALEMGGWLITTEEEVFQVVTHEVAYRAIAECGFSPAEQARFEEDLVAALSWYDGAESPGAG